MKERQRKRMRRQNKRQDVELCSIQLEMRMSQNYSINTHISLAFQSIEEHVLIDVVCFQLLSLMCKMRGKGSYKK